MPNDRLTPLDASFLHIEDEAWPMHVACVMVFDGRAPDYEDLVSHVESRLPLVPRYRQKLASVPLGQGRPKWVDDDHFDLRYHVRSTALPRPGTEEELKTLAARVFSINLNREKPLWELWLVEGLEDDRFALLSKTHHALVDGVSGLDILSVIFAPDSEADAEASRRWEPQPAPSGLSMLAEALIERATMPAEIVRPVRAMLRRPRRVVGRAYELAVGLGAFAWAGLGGAPMTPYNRSMVGSNRRFTWVRADLAEVKAIKDALGGTVNDVILTVVTRGLRGHLISRGENVEGVTLKAFVPVSVRSDDQRGGETLGNQVAGMIAPLPVGCPDPRTCLATINAAMRGLKDSGQAVGAQALTELSGFAPPNLLDQAARLQIGQRFVNLVVTNVPGPQFALHLADRQLADIFPLVPLGNNLNLGVAIVSYNGTINFGLVSDFDALPDLEAIAEQFEAGLAELAEEAGIEPDLRRREDALLEQQPPVEEPAAVADAGATAARTADSREIDPAEVVRPLFARTETRPPLPEEDHIDTEDELVESFAERGAESGAGAEVEIAEPWKGYDRMKVAEIRDRLEGSQPAMIAVVELYESSHKARKQVLAAAERAMVTAGR